MAALHCEHNNDTVKWKEDNCVSEIVTEEDIHETTNLISEIKGCEESIYQEKLESGSVKFESYKKYVKFGGGLIMFTAICLAVGVVQFSKSGMKKLENNWIITEQKIINYTNYNTTGNENYINAIKQRSQMIYLFPVALGMVSIITFLKGALHYLLARKASINFHTLLMEKVLNASMEFFSDHYLGHILNRFSEDLLYIDERVPYSLYLGLEAIAEMAGIIILMGTVNMTFLMASFAFCILPLVTSIFCLKIGRALKRLEISTRCSLLGHINATTEGLPTIRSARVENILIQEFDRHQDLYTSASYLYLCWFRALGYIVDICFVIFTTGIIIILLFNEDDISAAHVGFVLSQASLFKRSLDVGFRRITKLETEMTAVERILDYTKQKLEPKSGTVVDGWPQREGIKFSNVYFSYSSADNNVLLNLNFIIEPHKTVAIVGRTGAGKSSIISTILRLRKFQGNISVDGVDITTLPLDNLRSNISVISQDPVLFTGTVRENIDLSGKYQDDEIWNALRTVNLEMLFPDLNYRISSVDVNLSLGQKQLFCLARAIVRKNKIIIMDEVTANVDQGAEAMIHKIVREEFSQCTVIMITHKLDYVLECDKVMVLDKGRIVEFDCPSVLLNNKNGLFYSMFSKVA
ncbi:hypothetical protein MTP99_009493 [Tenebrio molitor]|nr:hypothetical protein MTP99_009493 [Tenebrio molitor]